jgi:hypothetical protein
VPAQGIGATGEDVVSLVSNFDFVPTQGIGATGEDGQVTADFIRDRLRHHEDRAAKAAQGAGIKDGDKKKKKGKKKNAAGFKF